MKNFKRAERRHKSKCKLEKRLKIWVYQGKCFRTDNVELDSIGGHELEIIRNEIRSGKLWTFLQSTSTPCSCYLCQGNIYKRSTKSETKKIIEEELYE